MKTINIKHLFILITSILLYTYSSGQSVSDSSTLANLKRRICNGYMNSTYLFEGKLDSSTYFTVKTGEYTYANYMAYLVEVDKVIKGNIQKGTIELVYYADGITYKGPDHTSSMYTTDNTGSGAPAQGIYLGFDSARHGIVSHYKNSNHKTLFFHGGIAITKDGKLVKDARGALTASYYFSTLDDFYAYIKANYGIDVSGK